MEAYLNGTCSAELKSYDRNVRAYVFTNTATGKTFLARKGQTLAKDFKFSYGNTYKMEIGKKNDSSVVWFINTVEVLTTESSSKKGNGYDSKGYSEGQEQGNYRTNCTEFITTFFAKKAELPSKEDVIRYNELLKVGESDFKGVSATPPADSAVTSTEVPPEGTGVLPTDEVTPNDSSGTPDAVDSECPF